MKISFPPEPLHHEKKGDGHPFPAGNGRQDSFSCEITPSALKNNTTSNFPIPLLLCD
ncbi:hypothetical protein HMPREF3038_01374 [Akkermansia sp. KLE1797]|nr:hypothetical protein HMPREF3038_01374 [Akkermansia sp. KLE1797]KXU55551.1 hypothetical protein HMPREF3039_00282 [Akkermansia sp. KLE1798]